MTCYSRYFDDSQGCIKKKKTVFTEKITINLFFFLSPFLLMSFQR